jgi:hypothetical protein
MLYWGREGGDRGDVGGSWGFGMHWYGYAVTHLWFAGLRIGTCVLDYLEMRTLIDD